MKNHSKFYIAGAAAMVALMASCAVDQDSGASNSVNALYGRAVDGYLAGSLIYVDSNENGKLDVWEERGVTDIQGFIGYNPNSTTDYCADGVAVDKAIHCLKIVSDKEVTLRVVGGYDLSTSAPFTGSMYFKVDAKTSSISNLLVSSPIQSLMALLSDADKATMLTNENTASTLTLTSADLASDFMAFVNPANVTAQEVWLVKLAIELQKTTDIIGGNLAASYSGSTGYKGFGESGGLPDDGNGFVYQAIANRFATVAPSTSMNAFITSDINNIINEASNLAAAKLALLNDLQTAVTPNTALVATLNSRVTNMLARIQDIFVTNSATLLGATITAAQMNGGIRAIDAITRLSADPAQTDVGTIATVITFSNDPTYITNLANPGADVLDVVAEVKAGTVTVVGDVDNYAARSTVDSIVPGNNLDGQQLALEDGTNSVALQFTGGVDTDLDGSADEGTLTLQIDAFSTGGGNDLFTPTDSDGDGVADPISITGDWQKLDDYSMLLTIEPVPGVTETLIVKPSVDELGNTIYNFDLGGETIEWNAGAGGTNGFTAIP
ncbi:MAG: hypothetical protein OEY38_10665 [Gammaproteobacteria bacterium]|nr:hypothetical protein [Gammaproteobacteria bacterium]